MIITCQRNHHTGPHQMSEREVSHFIHTYGLPSPPNRPAGSITLPPSPRRSPRPPASGAGAGRGVRFADDEEDVEGGGGGGRRVRGGHSAEGRVSVGDMDDDDSSVSSDDEDVKLVSGVVRLSHIQSMHISSPCVILFYLHYALYKSHAL